MNLVDRVPICIVLVALLVASVVGYNRTSSIEQRLNTPATLIRVGGSDVAVDPVSGQCYRLAWVVETDHYPAALVTTDGVDCTYGVGLQK